MELSCNRRNHCIRCVCVCGVAYRVFAGNAVAWKREKNVWMRRRRTVQWMIVCLFNEADWSWWGGIADLHSEKCWRFGYLIILEQLTCQIARLSVCNFLNWTYCAAGAIKKRMVSITPFLSNKLHSKQICNYGFRVYFSRLSTTETSSNLYTVYTLTQNCKVCDDHYNGHSPTCLPPQNPPNNLISLTC